MLPQNRGTRCFGWLWVVYGFGLLDLGVPK